jgi:shikimate kinase
MKEISSERLYLIGFMGAGKSTVGQTLADSLGWPFQDLDHAIEDRTGQSIREIFQEEGEEVFREKETDVLREESRRDPPFVLATGGGVPERSINRKIMSKFGVSIYLNVDFDVIYERIGDDETRPLVKRADNPYKELKSLWKCRQPYYNSADLVINLSNESPAAIVETIINRLKSV